MGPAVVRYDPTSLPADLLRSAESVTSFASVSRPVGPEALSALRTVAKQLELPEQDLLVACALVAVADFAGSRELCVGTGTDGPARSALSVALTEQDTLRGLATRLPAARHADGETPCPVAVTVGRAPLEAPSGLEAAIDFQLDELAASVVVHYAQELYEADTAAQLAEHIGNVLDAATADPDRSVITALRPGTVQALGFLVGPDAHPDPSALCHPGDLIRRWVERTPGATAILQAGGASLSYAELGALADDLADRIERADLPEAARVASRQPNGGGTPHGTTPHGRTPVAVLTSDSRTAAIAMVACQFLGRCHVLLDPEVPEGRNSALLVAAGCRVLLCDAASLERAAALSAATGVRVVSYVEQAVRCPASLTASAAPERVAGDEPAYIAFTSGTTGVPKGVVQPARSFAQFLDWQQRQLGLGPGSRVAMWSAPVFDACYMEVFGALAYGATLCVPPPGERRNPEAVAAWLSSAEVTFFQGIPSFIEYVVAALEAVPRPMTALRNVIVAGEVFPPTLAARLRGVFPSARLHNMFGPTECVLATRYEIPDGHDVRRRMPVGRPIAGRRILLMDADGNPVPRGAVGEIGVVGRYLATGYVGDAAQTSSRFRPLAAGPAGASAERPERRETVYHTGDFGRVGPDGELRYLGRRDAQIKVRGIRVNLDEVEAVLAARPEVGRCKVVDVRVAAGHVQLVAFVQPLPEPGQAEPGVAEPVPAEPAQAARWRAAVTEALGARVAPTRYLVLRRFPQTVTGKPDLGALRRMNDNLRLATSAPTATATATAPTATPPAATSPTPAAPAVTGTPLERIRRIAEEVTGRRVADDEDLVTTARDPLLLALRLRRALTRHFPGDFDGVDPRRHATVRALAVLAGHDDSDQQHVERH